MSEESEWHANAVIDQIQQGRWAALFFSYIFVVFKVLVDVCVGYISKC